MIQVMSKVRMRIHYPSIPFERYADDTICHCVSKAQAEYLKEVLICRFEQCRLKLNAEKTKIVQCPTSTRKKVEGYEASFDFLGYTFQCRKSWNRKQCQCFTNFLPAISEKSVKKLHEKMNEWKLHSHLDWKLNISHVKQPYHSLLMPRQVRCMSYGIVVRPSNIQLGLFA